MSLVAVRGPDSLIAEAIAARDATIPEPYKLPKSSLPLDSTALLETSGLMSEREQRIVHLTVIPLRDGIVAREYTAVEVATAYCKAAAIACQAVNCLVELFVDEALERARWLDEQLEATGKPVGVFHGVPVSIKASSL